ncbi:MAG: hypothetical protein AAGC46_03180 [Solirubrobacteraceae bacterium]|nr:hypothetical protein [Patulibacter sp.]
MARRRHPAVAAAAALIVVLVVVAGVVKLGRQSERSAAIQAEIADLKKSEATTRPSNAAASAPPLCQKLAVARLGRVTDGNLNELSGLVASRRTPHLLWGIDDSGAPPVLSAIRDDGSVAGNWTVPGAENVDWEDIAAGPGPDGPVIYAADIGDNNAVRASIDIYRVPEPVNAVGGGDTAPGQRLRLHYPDGAHDAETLLVDPKRGTLVVVTKGLAGGNAYALSPPLPWGGTATLRKIGPISIPLATGGDVSRDGSTIAVRGYFSLSVWKRRGGEPITTTLRRTPCVSPTGLDDGQGESLALSTGGTTAWTTAEGVHPYIRKLTAAKR